MDIYFLLFSFSFAGFHALLTHSPTHLLFLFSENYILNIPAARSLQYLLSDGATERCAPFDDGAHDDDDDDSCEQFSGENEKDKNLSQ